MGLPNTISFLSSFSKHHNTFPLLALQKLKQFPLLNPCLKCFFFFCFYCTQLITMSTLILSSLFNRISLPTCSQIHEYVLCWFLSLPFFYVKQCMCLIIGSLILRTYKSKRGCKILTKRKRKWRPSEGQIIVVFRYIERKTIKIQEIILNVWLMNQIFNRIFFKWH